MLGPLEVEPAVTLEPRDRIVLSTLVVRRGQAVSPDDFADAIWGDRLPSSWSKQVQICIARLRKAMGAEAIRTVPGGYQLALDGAELDVERFEHFIQRAREFAATDEPDRAVTAFARALSLWRGHPLEDLDRWLPGRSEVGRLEELHRGAQEDRLEAMLSAGEHRQVAAEAVGLTIAEPLRERRWAILALAQYRCGRQSEALQSLSMARDLLAEQSGIDPSPELVALEDAILRQDESLLASRHEPSGFDEACPYRGLAPYDAEDADDFFGRDREIELVLSRLESTPLLVVAGRSGSGKSSLIRAGVVPALKRQGRQVAVIVPGHEPEIALAEALSRSEDEVTLVVDQFEEMYALDEVIDVGAVCRKLARHARQEAQVIVVIRSDHLGELGRDPELRPLVERGLHLLSPPAGNDLREAITRPAEQAGLRLEHGLVDLLVRDTEGEPGALPLLSHALAETWQRRDGRVLTVEGYEATGGIRGAVARSADRLYEGLPVPQRELLRSVMLRLVSPSLEGDPVRRRITSRGLLGDVDRDRVVSLLVRSRLVTTGEDTVELAHEALARAWPRLRSWLDEDAVGQNILRHITESADAWESLGRPAGDLYRGARLETALEWRETTSPDLTGLEKGFLEASKAAAESETRALTERAQEEARQNRRLRTMLAMGAIFLVAALVGAVAAFRSGEEAQRQREVAETAQQVAEEAELEAELASLASQSLALRSTNRGVAALLGVEAYRRDGGAQAWSALLGTFTSAPNFLGYRYLPGSHLTGALVPGTSSAVVALEEVELALIDLETGELDTRFPAPSEDAVGSVVRVSGDGRWVAQLVFVANSEGCNAGGESFGPADPRCGFLALFDIATGERVTGPVSPAFGAGDIAINFDGSLVALAGGLNGDLALYRTSDGSLQGTIAGLGPNQGPGFFRNTAAVGFDANGSLYVGSQAGPIREIDPRTMEVTNEFSGPPMSSHLHLLTTPDGTVVAGGTDALIAVDGRTGETRWTVDIRNGIHPIPCPYMAVSARSEELFCGNLFGVVEERDLNTGALTGSTLDPQLGSVGSLTVTSDGSELVAFGAEAPVISRWRLDGGGMVSDLIAEGHAVLDGYNLAGDLIIAVTRPALATMQIDLTDVSLWDPVTDTRDQAIDRQLDGSGWVGPETIMGFDLEAGRLAYYDVAQQEFVEGVELPFGAEHIWPSADGQRMYVGFTSGEIWTVDSASRQRIEPTIQVESLPSSVSATRDGRQVVVTYLEGTEETTGVFDGETGELVSNLLAGPWTTRVSLDGVLVGAESGAITQYDLATLEPLAKVPGARGEVSSLQFSRDGSVLLVTSNDQTISVYDVATWTRIGDPLPTNSPFIFPGYLRPDGGAVALNAARGISVWDIDPDHLAEAACRLAGRNLTSIEWDTYLGALGSYRPTCPENES